MSVYFGYNAIYGTQTLVDGVPQNYAYAPSEGSTWSYTGDQTWFHVRENDGATVFNGDNTNEQIGSNEQIGGSWEQLAYVDGAYYQTIWDYTFTVSSGGDTYRVGVIDIDFNNNDFIDLETDNGYYLVFPDGVPPPGSYTVGPVVKNDSYTAHSEMGGTVVCFAAGTLIETPEGPRPIEDMVPGDLVLTKDRGPQPLRWSGCRRVPARGSMAPVAFAPGAIGNSRRLLVSPQHRILVSDWRAELLFGEGSVLVRAKDMVNGSTITRIEGGSVTYHHILFDRHEIVFAEGVASESFQPGEQSLASLAPEAAEELLTLFPDLPMNPATTGPAARRSLKSFEASCLLAA
ncbi:Hint domain-containing protein [Frigidibacter sp. ROC022]|uniref:Hint domain-containing protein n=1 Tax=Frigidibacter sp. ROC022 TaxID=2971796 RepID=UPI00215ABB71|nr:Hint domain-containing protein [Frigidibacter sp. ROC022]MCR8723358.1 Hint domain-containing protein [Frigidibacter sp. ROC022]